MPIFTVSIKWGREKFSGIECNTDEPPIVFKAQLFALSGVQPERQKVMVRGAVVKDDSWENINVKDGMTLLMMGSTDALPESPKEAPKFIEDLSEAQLASVLKYPAGLENLGNTCYMNATVQCLKSIPELRELISKYEGRVMQVGMIDPEHGIVVSLRDLFSQMSKAGTSVSPLILLHVLHMAFPRFAQQDERGGFTQQDASECWVELVRILQQKLLPPSEDGGSTTASCGKNFVDQYMGGTFDCTMKCVEEADEPETKFVDSFQQLSCFINQDVKYMHTGLKLRLKESVTKKSPLLARDAEYMKTSQISRLPAYLTIQFVRFYYKQKGAISAKILKDVKFPLQFDAFDLCTTELQQKLMPMRGKFKEHDDIEVETARDKTVKGVEKPAKKDVRRLPSWFDNDIGSNNSGLYELQAVLTHKGRSSSSGHYVAWVRHKDDQWFMFDDDQVSVVSSEDVLKLSGGGDWHMAYVLIYSSRVLEVPVEGAS